MTEVGEEWSVRSNDALSISLVTPAAGGSKTIASFHPKFTYHIFGDEETIFGYQGLKVHLRYNACDMRPGLQITYNKKFKAVGDTEATDIKAILEPLLPKAAFDKSSIFDLNINDEIYKDWKPPGELIHTVEVGNATYEIWKGSLVDKAIQQQIKRIQVLIPLFIEGGTFIDMADPEWSIRRWSVFFLYKKQSPEKLPAASPYVFMGYSTVYQYYPYQPLTPPASPDHRVSRSPALTFELPYKENGDSQPSSRSRISQFLILPPFQGGGNGSRFYETIFQHYLHSPQTIEITVEDPNEEFDDLRDINDLKFMRQLPEFLNIKIDTSVTVRHKGNLPADKIVDGIARETLRQQVKIAPRQFIRLLEMQLLSYIPTSIRKSLLLETKKGTSSELKAKENEYHLWQLFVKQRLYRHNKLSLAQLDRSERIDKLEDALDNVEADYARLLRTLEQRGDVKVGNVKGKRTSPDDGNDTGEPASKRARVEEA